MTVIIWQAWELIYAVKYIIGEFAALYS